MSELKDDFMTLEELLRFLCLKVTKGNIVHLTAVILCRARWFKSLTPLDLPNDRMDLECIKHRRLVYT